MLAVPSANSERYFFQKKCNGLSMEYSLTYKIENYNIAENVVKVFSGNVTQSEKKGH